MTMDRPDVMYFKVVVELEVKHEFVDPTMISQDSLGDKNKVSCRWPGDRIPRYNDSRKGVPTEKDIN